MIAPGEPLIKVDVGLSAGAVVDKEFHGGWRPGETPDRTAGQAQLPGGLRQVPALGQQAVHVSVPGPASEPPGSRQLQGCRLAGRRDPGPVPADHLSSRPGSQPRGERIRRALVQDVGRARVSTSTSSVP
jgi:hypothetical protein